MTGGRSEVVLPDACASSRWRPGLRPAAVKVSRWSDLARKRRSPIWSGRRSRSRGRRVPNRDEMALGTPLPWAGTGTQCATEQRASQVRSRTARSRANPYQVVEGLAIVALALDAREAFIALKASFVPERERRHAGRHGVRAGWARR